MLCLFPQSGQLRPNHSLASDTSSVTLKSTDFPGDPTSPISLISSDRPLPTPADDEAPVNPWLVPRGGDGDAATGRQRKHEVAVGKHSATAEKSKNKLRKKKQTLEEERTRAKEDAEVAISMADVLTLPSGSGSASSAQPSSAPPPAQGKKSAKAKGKAPARVQDGDEGDSSDDSDANSELEEQEKAVDSKLKGKSRAVKAFEQRDIVARAFAGDNVVQQFAEAKRLEMQEDVPKEVDTTLPGWVRSYFIFTSCSPRMLTEICFICRAHGEAQGSRRPPRNRSSSRR